MPNSCLWVLQTLHRYTVHGKSQHSLLKKKKCDVGNAESKPHLVGLDKGEA